MNEPRPDFRPIERADHELLVVDDNPASLYATVRQLRGAGFRVRQATTGTEALALADNTISAVVLDIHLPDIDGFELLAMLRSRPGIARLPVLHLTAAYVTDEDKVRGLDSGADAYLARPVEVAVLVSTVQALVRTRVAEEAMRLSEARFRAIYAQSPSGIGLIDPEGRVLDANPALLTLLDRPAHEVLGQPLSSFAPGEWAHQLAAFATAKGAPLAAQEVPMRRPDGSLAYLEWSVTPDVDVGVTMVVANDVTQRLLLVHQRQQLLDRERVARGEAEQVSRLKDDLIAVLSHELRTPLNAIMGWTHVLMKRGDGTELQRGLEAIERNGRMQARMIADLLDMSRLNLGKLPLVFETLDLRSEIESSVSSMRATLEDRQIDLQLVLPESSAPLRADAARIQQIVWNLLSNAIKFSERGGRILLELAQDDDGFVLRVTDFGQGIAPDFLPFVFDRFAQSDAARNRQRGGLGLGLSIVKQLVEAHGGSIGVASRGIGLGATFEVRLPFACEHGDDAAVVTAESELLEPADTLDTSLAGIVLLIVDDDRDAAAMLDIILSDRGATVQSAHDTGEALQLLETLMPDALISDVGMPGRDGYDLIRELRRREVARAAAHGLPPRHASHLPAIALTSFTRDQDREQALAAGFDLHCGKPLRPLVLIQKIRRLVEQRR